MKKFIIILMLVANIGLCGCSRNEEFTPIKDPQTYEEAWELINERKYNGVVNVVHQMDDYSYNYYVVAYSGPNNETRCVRFIDHSKQVVSIYFGISDSRIEEDIYIK